MSNAKYLSILDEIKKKGGSLDSGEPNDKVLIIDGLNTFIRVFSVIPTTNDDGIHIGGIVGFLRSIGYTINMIRPTRVIIVFDGKGGSIDNGEPDDKVLIIDGLNTFIRVFSVIPTTNDDGIHVGGIVGFLRSIGYTINMFRPTRVIIVFDGKGGSTRRRKLYPEYKAKRKTKYRVNRAYDFASPEDEKQNMIMQLQRIV